MHVIQLNKFRPILWLTLGGIVSSSFAWSTPCSPFVHVRDFSLVAYQAQYARSWSCKPSVNSDGDKSGKDAYRIMGTLECFGHLLVVIAIFSAEG